MSMIDKDLDCIISNFINPFDWDKTLYKFNRAEKDMNPYSIVNKKDEVIIVHNILGIDKKVCFLLSVFFYPDYLCF